MINKCCILVSENTLDQQIFTQALNDVSPETICFPVSSALEALHVINTEQVVPEFIFMELNAPSMNAIEFLNMIKKTEVLRDIHVIVHTMSPQPHKILEI